ncbi:hypothetical protein JYU03_00185 [bacterium AH-315-F03]|nr:hypothetical protein [bacterium AH-315-F03]
MSGKQIPNSHEHLSEELLTSYYEHPEKFHGDAVNDIQVHLASCETCRTDLEFLVSLERDLVSSVVTGAASDFGIRNAFDRISVFLKQPALAYFLIAVMIYPTISWLSEKLVKTPELQISERSIGTVILSGSLRSNGEIQTVLRQSDTQIIRFQVPIYHVEETMRYEFSFRDVESDNPVLVEYISDYREDASILLTTNTGSLSDAEYVLEVTEHNRKSNELSKRLRFTFRLKTE